VPALDRRRQLEAETRFRKVQGYRGLANLAVKIEHDLLRRRQQAAHTTIEEEAAALTVYPSNPDRRHPEFHDERGNLPCKGQWLGRCVGVACKAWKRAPARSRVADREVSRPNGARAFRNRGPSRFPRRSAGALGVQLLRALGLAAPRETSRSVLETPTG